MYDAVWYKKKTKIEKAEIVFAKKTHATNDVYNMEKVEVRPV